MSTSRGVLAWTAAAVTAACVGALEIAGKECPCPDGYTCDLARSVCVASTAPPPPPPPPREGGSPPDAPGAEAAPCTDVASDPNNCGACGHSCLGGACSRGVCQPVTLAAGQNATSIAADADYVYWGLLTPGGANTGNIARCAKTGCAEQPSMLFADMTHTPTSLLVIGTDLYFADAANVDATLPAAVRKCSPSDCAGTLQTLVVEGNRPEFLVGDATALFWVYLSSTHEVHTCPLSGCASGATVLDSSTTYFVQRIALTPTDLYTLVLNPFPMAPLLLTCPRSGCGSPPTVFATLATGSMGPSVAGPSVDATSVYFRNELSLQSCPLSNCSSPVTLAMLSSTAGVPVVDGSGLYWADSAGTISRCTLPGCPGGPVVLAFNQALPETPVLDSVGIYWLAQGDGSVRMLAK